MTNSIIDKLCEFRNRLFDLFIYRADSTMDLIDAIAGQVSKESIVKLSLNELFRRSYSSITDVVDNLFRRKANKNPKPNELLEDQMKITNLISEQCPKLVSRPFHLFAIDCSSTPRIYSDKMEDRGFVHSPTKVPGQKPVTVGHQYSTLVYLPERLEPSNPHWVIPLSVVRVKTEESGTSVGMTQISQTVTNTSFKDHLCLVTCDSAYSHTNNVMQIDQVKNLVFASRMRNNRKFYTQLPGSCTANSKKKRGRPKVYGESWVLNNPGNADECEIIDYTTASGKVFKMKIERWCDRIDKGKINKPSESAEQENTDKTEDEVVSICFDAIRVTMFKSNGKPAYKKPLWIMVTGDRRREICLKDIAISYLQRFDIEHFFRFAKQKLLLTSFQTPDVRHEENWWWLCIMSYVMLYLSRTLGEHIINPWEKKLNKKNNEIMSPTQIQRSYERIIRRIGTPSCFPKPRGKSVGRVKGTVLPKRIDRAIIKKSKKPSKRKESAAA